MKYNSPNFIETNQSSAYRLGMKSSAGITIIEMVIVIVVLGIALVVITQMLGQNTIRGAYTYDET
ncbi:MAG TPA: hypothetical protein DCS80_07145, partial [Betaproteobacteria bacterium]|nr:hypothetical protein [Betaproteobacteria bacterium]